MKVINFCHVPINWSNRDFVKVLINFSYFCHRKSYGEGRRSSRLRSIAHIPQNMEKKMKKITKYSKSSFFFFILTKNHIFLSKKKNYFDIQVRLLTLSPFWIIILLSNMKMILHTYNPMRFECIFINYLTSSIPYLNFIRYQKLSDAV